MRMRYGYNLDEIEVKVKEELEAMKKEVLEMNEFMERLKIIVAKEVVRQKFEDIDDIDDIEIKKAMKYIGFTKAESVERAKYVDEGGRVWKEVDVTYMIYLLYAYDLSFFSGPIFISDIDVLEKHKFVVVIRCIVDKLKIEEKQYIKLKEIVKVLAFE